ncbi:MAG: methyltransferase domain-containing protein [Acetobacteraceae bacterium]
MHIVHASLAVPYPDVLNPDLLDRIPLDARIVLDVGCGTGALGAAYRRLNPRARLLGIDKDAEVAAVAGGRLDEVAVVDVEVDPLPFRPSAGIDCIVYGDILEHLGDPWTVLRRHAEALSDDGTVVICIPNVEHWSFVARLLRGDWDYEPSGLLDETHLRWFSLDSMRQVLVDTGLALCDVHPRVFHPERAQAFVTAVSPSLRAMGVDPQEYYNRASPLQYVWRARKRPRERLTIASTMMEPVGGVSHVRVVYPLRAMASDASVHAEIVALSGRPATGAGSARIYVLHRPVLAGSPGAEVLRSLLNDDWVVVTEFDDHPDFFRVLQEGHQLTFSGVHAVQTSTNTLAEVLRPRNPEVKVFANAVRELPEPRNFSNPDHVTLFFGALNRERDWEPLLPALSSVAAAVGPRLRFQVVHDRAFFDALDTPHKTFTPLCDHDTYMALLGGCEISLMPLSDTPFNRAKSDLKFIEAGACRVAALASPIVYADSIVDGTTGVIFRSPDELRERLLRLLAMPYLARALGEAARQYVAEYRMLAYQVAPRLAWYRSLWSRRAELTAALRARVQPALMMPIP